MANLGRQRWINPRGLASSGTLMLLALLPLLLIIRSGYDGLDFRFHATSWLELHDAWIAHTWRLGWAQWAHFGFGEPRFCFYPPLSLLIGGGLSFLMPFRAVPGVMAWLVLSLSGWSMYKAAESFVGREHRLSAAILYMLNPYLLLTVLRRYAIAEAWVQALLPLMFLYFFQAISERRPRAAGIAILLLAAGWLTDIPEAIAIFYAFNFLAIVLAVRQRSIRPLAMAALIGGAAIALAAFRLLPALQEQGWISPQAFPRNLQFYMLFGKMAPDLRFGVWFDAVYIVLGVAIMLPAVRQIVRWDSAWHAPVISFVFLAGFAVFLNFTVSIPVWNVLPEFRLVQHPFRLLPLLSVGLIYTLFSRGVSSTMRKLGVACLICGEFLALASLASPYFSLRQFHFRDNPSLRVQAAEWQGGGYQGQREYVPAGVSSIQADPSHERDLAKQGAFATSDCNPTVLQVSPDEKIIRTDSLAPCTLALNTFYYPFWKAYSEDGASLAISESHAGLLQAAVPGGLHEIRFEFVPASRLRAMSFIASLLMLVVLLSWTAMSKARFRLRTQNR
jgi:hypothetical protein